MLKCDKLKSLTSNSANKLNTGVSAKQKE